MRSQNLSHSVRRTWPVLLAGSAAITSATQAHAADWTKHFRVGMQVTLNIEAEMTSGGFFDIQTRPGRYDDGYVLADATGNPDLTTNWRYVRDEQWDPLSREMTFRRAESFSTGFSETKKDDSPYIGLELAYGTSITRWGNAIIGWEAGYSFLPISISDSTRAFGDVTVGVFTHEVPAGGDPPPAPYTGPTSGQGGVVIERDFVRGESEILDGTARGSRSLDVSLHTLRLGPTIHFDLARRWAVQGGVGPMVGFVTGDYSFDEELTIAGNRQRGEGEFGGDEFVYGGYAQALLLFHFEEHGDIYAGLQFMGLSGADFEEDGRGAKLNMGATLSFLVGVNWPF